MPSQIITPLTHKNTSGSTENPMYQYEYILKSDNDFCKPEALALITQIKDVDPNDMYHKDCVDLLYEIYLDVCYGL